MTDRLPPRRRPTWSPLILAGGSAVALVVAVLVGASPADTAVLVGIAGGSAAAAAGATLLVLARLRHRSLVTHSFVVALGAVTATAVGVGAAAWAMFLSAHDLGVLSIVLVLSATVAASAAWALGSGLRDSVEAIGAQVDALDSDGVLSPAEHLVTAEMQRLSRVLARAHRQLVEARERAARLESSRRELVAWVSHDLRSPIGAIRAMAEALEDGVVAEPEEVLGYHRAIRQEAERLARLVDDLFELARIEAGAPSVDVPFVPMHELIGEVVEAAAARAEAHGVRLRPELDDVGPELVVSADLRRALDNVLDNAIRHTVSGGTVTATVRAEGSGMVLVVGDECGGIPADDLDRVFDVAFRGDVSRSRDTGGGGLGLAIARGLVEARAGRISVRNRAGGCEFTVRLPVRAA